MERYVLGLVSAETVVFSGSHWTVWGTADISSVSSSVLKTPSLNILLSVTSSIVTSSSVKLTLSKISDIICSVSTLKSRKGSFLLVSFRMTFEISIVSLVSFLSNISSSIHMSSVPKFWNRLLSSITSSIRPVIFCCFFYSVATSLISSYFVLRSIKLSSTKAVSVSISSAVWSWVGTYGSLFYVQHMGHLKFLWRCLGDLLSWR